MDNDILAEQAPAVVTRLGGDDHRLHVDGNQNVSRISSAAALVASTVVEIVQHAASIEARSPSLVDLGRNLVVTHFVTVQNGGVSDCRIIG